MVVFAAYGRLLYRLRWWILVIALAATVGAVFYASGVYKDLVQSGFTVPGSQSESVSAVVNKSFGGDRDSLVVLFSSSKLTVNTPRFRQAELAVLAPLAHDPGISTVETYYSTNDASFVSRTQHESYALVGLKGNSDQQATTVSNVSAHLKSNTLTIQLGGAAAVDAASTTYVKQDLSRAELIALPITALLLILIYNSLAAAALPLAVGGYGIVGALVITRLVTHATDISVYALNLISLLGLGLAIDYSLFIVSRFREELKHDPEDIPRALERTVSTAGRTVLFSGLTVLIALAGLIVFPLGYLRSMGIGGSAAVLVALLGALFFLPAILAIMGTRVNALHVASLVPRRLHNRKPGPGVWGNICHKVMRWPYVTVAITLAFIVFAGVPFLRIHFTNPDYRILPQSSQAYLVGKSLSGHFADGDKAPILVLLRSSHNFADPHTLSTLYGYTHQLEHLPHVQSVVGPVSSPSLSSLAAYEQFYHSPRNSRANASLQQFTSGPYTLLQVIPTTTTYARTTEDLLRTIRGMPVHGFVVSVGGQTADLVDLLGTISHYGIYAVIIIVGAMLVLFFLMLGSIVIPLKTILLNILSLAAAFGALVWVFQMGHLDSLLGITPEGGIDATQPVIIFALAFGLSMDYAIFLFSRVKEHFDEQADIEKAIAWGVQKTGGIITSAALLLLVVIVAFSSGRIAIMKEVGIGLIVAVLVDVFVVRLLLVPASMRLLDKYNWWAPKPLRALHDKLGIKESE